jgi:hypothetical protein
MLVAPHIMSNDNTKPERPMPICVGEGERGFDMKGPFVKNSGSLRTQKKRDCSKKWISLDSPYVNA